MPTWIDADAYLFDIDGTLLNATGGTHTRAFETAVQQVLGLTDSLHGLPVHGNTDIGILRALVRRAGYPEPEFETKLPELLEIMRSEVDRNHGAMKAQVCPSVPELIRFLSGRGKLLGVASGNLESIGWLKVQAAGLREYFSFGAFSDHLEHRAEIFAYGISQAHSRLGETASICVVGDTPSDIAAAKEVGIPVIAVATGVFPFETLQGLGPDVCFRCCADLLAIAPQD